MPNHVTNIIKIKGDPARVKVLFEAVKSDEHGLGSIDFSKLTPMPPELDIEESSQTTRSLKVYKEFVEVYTFNGRKEDFDLLDIPEKAEQAFLRIHPDIDRASWNLGRRSRMSRSTALPPGTNGAPGIGAPNGMPMVTRAAFSLTVNPCNF